MKQGTYEQVPLTRDDKDMLFTILDYRRRFLFVVFAILIAIALFIPFRHVEPGYFKMSLRELSHVPDMRGRTLSLSFILPVLVLAWITLIVTKVSPYRRDISSGVKDKIPYLVEKKQYFPTADRYYLTLNDPKYLYHETNADLYNSINEGDYVYLYRATKSKYVFEDNGKFTVL